MSGPHQIYSATYSNVPVFEFVTSEGPIMRRKSDSWINATHILKIARFPKPKRTRILEKDVQVGIHEKVQGGYGKYQGTYVPLDRGADIARSFGVYDVLEPIFTFRYVEGRSQTPPPAPKHSHASASNVARKAAATGSTNTIPGLLASLPDLGLPHRKRKPEPPHEPKKRGRPRRAALNRTVPPPLQHSSTVPLDLQGPNIGTFSSRRDHALSSLPYGPMPSLSRQDTEKDALHIMASHMDVKNDDLEGPVSASAADDDPALMSSRELFGTRDSFERAIHAHRRPSSAAASASGAASAPAPASASDHSFPMPRLPPLNASYSLHNSLPSSPAARSYFDLLLHYLLHDDHTVADLARDHADPQSCLPADVLAVPDSLTPADLAHPVDNDGNTIFHWAYAMANRPLLTFLSRAFPQASPSDATNYHGETPLMFMVAFSNSFHLNNFPHLLDSLRLSIFAVDSRGRSVLHHIARNTAKTRHNPPLNERYSAYYLAEVLHLAVDVASQDRLSRWLNQQDTDGNTAFHIFAHNLNKRCIALLIDHHSLIDFSLRNAINHTVEDYLASQNYVLKIESDIPSNGSNGFDGSNGPNGPDDVNGANGGVPSSVDALPFEPTQSFDAHLQQTKAATALYNTMSNAITEKLGDLMYVADKELAQKDEKLFALFQCLKSLAHAKFMSQKFNLHIFSLDYLVDDIAKEFETNASSPSAHGQHNDALVVDTSRDRIIQDEITRLLNDITFQLLSTESQLAKLCGEYRQCREKQTRGDLENAIESVTDSDNSHLKLDTAIELCKEIQRRKRLANDICMHVAVHPLAKTSRDEFKENSQQNDSQSSQEGTPTLCSEDPRLFKYCKLVALSCGMSFLEVEQSIDLIEESLARNQNV